MISVTFITKEKDGIKTIHAIDREKLDEFVKYLNVGEKVRADFRKQSDKEYDRQRNRAHYFAYLRQCISDFECISAMVDGTKSISAQVQQLHITFKRLACDTMPHLYRTKQDKDGKDFTCIFSLEDGGTCDLIGKELKEYYDFVYETIVDVCKKATGHFIPPYKDWE